MQRETGSKYKSVRALLLYWEFRDETLDGVESEVYKLQRMFQNYFCFQTETWKLPCNNTVRTQLVHKLNSFSKDAVKGELLILYYGGHANSDDGSCTWSAGVGDHQVQWNDLAPIFTGNKADVLFILDCCEAASAVAAFSGRQARHGANWLLASSGIDKGAAPVLRNDFTRVMIRTLKGMVDDFYEHDEPRFTSEDLHTILHLEHWQRLRTSAVHIRLNRYSCAAIDLAPLIVRSDRTPYEDGLKYQLEYPLSSGSPSTPTTSLDILLVPGGNGNPVTSFTARLRDGKCMWPQDVLCPELEKGRTDLRIHCRLLPFQYHWSGNGYSDADVRHFKRCSQALENVIHSLWRKRPRRRLLFLAYGRGCTVVRKALHDFYQRKGSATNLPMIGCILCGKNGGWEDLYRKEQRPEHRYSIEKRADVILWINRSFRKAPRSDGNRRRSAGVVGLDVPHHASTGKRHQGIHCSVPGLEATQGTLTSEGVEDPAKSGIAWTINHQVGIAAAALKAIVPEELALYIE